MTRPGLDRRTALAGIVGVGALPVLAACAGDDGATTAADPAAPATDAPPTPDPTPVETPTPTEAPTTDFASTADVPVGGGAVFEEQRLVVTQPTAGEFVGFSFVCTHTGCPVNQVTDSIRCPCHGSTFSLVDGAPTGGPATRPLDPMPLRIEGDRISLA